MQFNHQTILLTSLVACAIAGSALGHDGRRFDVKVVDNQLVAHGYISSGVDDMGSNLPADNPGDPLYRTYYNAIHAHWSTQFDLFSSADLPGFDINDTPELDGQDLWLELKGVKKWSAAPFVDFAGGHGHGSGHAHGGGGGGSSATHTMSDAHTAMHADPMHGSHDASDSFQPHFESILTGETVEVIWNGNTNTTLTQGVPVELRSASESFNHFDFSFNYLPDGFVQGDISTAAPVPNDALFLVELELSTSDPTIANSQTIYAIFSPLGSQVDGSHGLSLATEAALGTPIPEPASLAVLLALAPALLRRRDRSTN